MYRFDTLSVHAGQQADPATALLPCRSFYPTPMPMKARSRRPTVFDLKDGGYIYTRLSNPTTAVLEQRIAALEGGVGAIAAASGHAAEILGFLTLLSAGDHIVSSANIYGGTYNILSATLPRYGIETTFVNPDDPENFRKAMRKNTKLVYLEQLGNPVINIVDVDAVAEIAHSQGVALMVDNTFPTPYLYRPFEHGADLIVTSATKYIRRPWQRDGRPFDRQRQI